MVANKQTQRPSTSRSSEASDPGRSLEQQLEQELAAKLEFLENIRDSASRIIVDFESYCREILEKEHIDYEITMRDLRNGNEWSEIALGELFGEAGGLPNDTKTDLSEIIDNSYYQISLLYNNTKRIIESGRIVSEEQADGARVDPFLKLETYAKLHKGEGVADFARELFAPLLATATKRPAGDGELSASPLPLEAPETYQGLRGPETPPEFVRRVYGPWLGQGLDRAHIRHLDPVLSRAIDNWSSRSGNRWPDDVDLPTRGEQNRRTVEDLRTKAPDGDPGKVLGEFTLREATRLRSAIQRAAKRDK